jgi:hypothetical protein
MDEKLLRLISALDNRGYKKHGRATRLHHETNYAVSTISEVLKGSVELTERFAKIVCSAAGISFEWVWNNKGEMFIQPQTIAEQIGEGYSPQVKFMADYLELKLEGKTRAEGLAMIEDMMAVLREKYK